VMCADLSPTGRQLVLGGEDGRVYRIGVEGRDDVPLLVTAMQGTRPSASLLDKLFGKTRLVPYFQYACPACQWSTEAPKLPSQPFACPSCNRRLQIAVRLPQTQQS
jgi:hypothetical protein